MESRQGEKCQSGCLKNNFFLAVTWCFRHKFTNPVPIQKCGVAKLVKIPRFPVPPFRARPTLFCAIRCVCDAGFSGDGYNCVDIDECTADPTLCKHGACLNYGGQPLPHFVRVLTRLPQVRSQAATLCNCTVQIAPATEARLSYFVVVLTRPPQVWSQVATLCTCTVQIFCSGLTRLPLLRRSAMHTLCMKCPDCFSFIGQLCMLVLLLFRLPQERKSVMHTLLFFVLYLLSQPKRQNT